MKAVRNTMMVSAIKQKASIFSLLVLIWFLLGPRSRVSGDDAWDLVYDISLYR